MAAEMCYSNFRFPEIKTTPISNTRIHLDRVKRDGDYTWNLKKIYGLNSRYLEPINQLHTVTSAEY